MNSSTSHGDDDAFFVEFRDVPFAYPARAEQPVLRGLSLSVRRGQTVAIVGPSGGGKSTVIQLLLRFYDPSAGSVRVGGADVRAVPVAALRRRFGWVQQEAPLWADSIAYNVAYGAATDAARLEPDGGVQPESKPAEAAAVVAGFSVPAPVAAAARSANAHGFVEAFAHGFATFAGARSPAWANTQSRAPKLRTKGCVSAPVLRPPSPRT
jgi:ATP-binding cassette subfamily B protein